MDFYHANKAVFPKEKPDVWDDDFSPRTDEKTTFRLFTADVRACLLLSVLRFLLPPATRQLATLL